MLGSYKDRILPTYPEAVVSVKNIPDSDYIREEDSFLAIGAGATLKKISAAPSKSFSRIFAM